MDIITVLKIAVVAAPLIGAVIVWLGRGRLGAWEHRLPALILAGAALGALAVFWLSGEYACVLTTGQGSCFNQGTPTLLAALVAGVLAWRCAGHRKGDTSASDFWLLLVSSAVSGLCFADNLFELVVFLNLLWYSMYRLLKHTGVHWGMFVVWPDDKE